ncbi:precorrin-3B C(17)-methyltransferase [Thermoleptolyngbya sichuanensis A183]|uniref:Precorrin-3B C(17)-methyltransferase n=1 Tax=Thermoleptolyngbya sichuanensis A183 TaxID=2737172 RepID=A0A6M8BFV8_9CYAN|nr:precorrin-3B C(17)-methyltransferase [Thermoleptolyngbya sichuanensis]QKD85092.1 precorrin-3B C(17)-methyltransferase [Thermoleptolyngbya sichuanensis A183]
MLLFQDFQPIAAIAPTPLAVKSLRALAEGGEVTLWVPADLATDELPCEVYQTTLRELVNTLWQTHRALVFGLATGAVVRLIGPLLQDKMTDPAVLVVDGAGKGVISLCGGHQGGADWLARAIALRLNATPILTGGANALALPGIDVLGEPFGWRKGSGDWTGVSGAIARQQPVQVIQEAGSTLWQDHLPPDHPFVFGWDDPTAAQPNLPKPAARVWISPIQRRFADGAEVPSDCPKVQWHPRVLWVGMGCERGTPRGVIEAAVADTLRRHHLAEGAIAGLASLDLKADEAGLLEFCGDRHLPLLTFSAETLRAVPVPTPSAVVESEVGTPSVAEAAAILAASRTCQRDRQPQTFAPLRVSKQIFRLPDHPGAVTIAVAQAEQEYTGRIGRLWLVGTGPGRLEQITPAAQAAIASADVVIGYSLYMNLVAALLHPGQIVEALPITQERQRAERAIALAQWGLTVAVISSGDCGIYGMAGLVLEQLQAQGWDGQTPAVQVFPGISALQAAASRVGAPLMHDFCAISLSDLLTPWPVIERRLAAAAAADFVTALYNPKSQTRTEQIAIAQRIFLDHRAVDTPVALVRAAYRNEEQITLTTLGQLLDCPIDMLTTVVIGNQSTRFHEGWMITPRGYLGFEKGT